MKTKLIIITVILGFIYGCVPSKPTYKESEIPPERLVKKLEINRRKIKTFEGSGVLNIESQKVGNVKASFNVMLKKPDSMRVSIYGPFGIDLAHAIVTNRSFKFYDVMKNRVFFGDLNDRILKDIFKVDLSFRELIDAFSGSVNLTEELSEIPEKFESGDGLFRLTYSSVAGRKAIYTILGTDLAIDSYSVFDSDNKLKLKGEYSDFRKFNDVSVPYVSKIENTDTNQKVRIEYRDISVNDEIESLAFKIPSDVEYIRL